MRKNTIKYVGFYDLPNSKNARVCNLAATNKMNYICSVLNRLGHQVEIVSPSWMTDTSEKGFEKGKKIALDDNLFLISCPSWKTKYKFTRNIKIFFSLVWLFCYLIFNVKKDEKVFAYHVQWISIPLRLAKYIKKFSLILEVEEIYGEVWKESKKLQGMEEKLIKKADKYIFVSEILKEKVNSKGKDSVVLYGSYVLPEIKRRIKFNENEISLVYAGSIDSIKGGAYKAVEAMLYLPKGYKLHIIGHGSEDQLSYLSNLIKQVNAYRKNEVCVYDGTLVNEEYTRYLLNCDIALNPQNEGIYMSTAFPSKVISYLSHDLYVISTEIESVKKSSISKNITFLKDNNPQSIAKAILNADLSSVLNNNKLIKKLDDDFLIGMKRLLN